MITNIGAKAAIQGAINATHASRISRELIKKKNEMTLDEAIKHCEDKIDDTQCGKEHKQLRDWLIELKNKRKQEN